ncbi:MAG: TIGR00341 family protein [Candidatus Magasanikbacteria bacterium CG10_big_fil_rev_8_21_14_0_10_47_10]|uniref:TIGR00341 family protein n=1 Tax=Candidatus Magasanikbacteria bacterium CG10_big_fil_rev_8_21_14_0_10_47_10 TaxID=1974652 RepID=A0A2H0TR81_9BACT|nr:MAG: TIGR00341 family protein [Candidatus Magasanikbacteria bacterium CG10_big_fil_rev_8_21_14_0_10_47_10]
MSIFSHATHVRHQTEKRLAQYAQPSVSYFLLIGLASAISTIGLLMNNVSVIIGAMVVAPLITPIFGFSLGVLVLQVDRIVRSFFMLLSGSALAITVSFFLSWVIQQLENEPLGVGTEILTRAEPHYLLFLVALFSGAAGAYAYSKKEIAASIAGIAISVSVIPPLSVTGIGMALLSSDLIYNSLSLFFFNLIGIAFGSVLMFIALGFGKEV